MGRPLNKKYFGNRNIGTNGGVTADDGLGGEGVASAAVSGGSYTTRPTLTFTAPELPGGITATATVLSKAKTASISGTQTRAYPTGTGSILYGTSTWTPTITSSALTNVVRASATTLGFDTTTTAMISGTSIHITGASITGTMTIGGVAIAAGQIYYVGAPTTATTATLYATYADSQAATSPLTIVAGTGVGGATFTRGVTYGTVTAVTVATVGSFTTLASGAQDVTTSTAGVGEGLQITVTYEALGTTITNKGSGYLAAPTAATGPTQSVTLGSVVLTTDSGGYDGNGALNVTGNQENAITIYAYIPTANGGSSSVVGDIKKQQGSRRYKVTTAQGTGVCKLVAAAPSAGQATIIATDYNTNTYYVTKLTNHKALLTQIAGGSNYVYATGDSARWSFAAATGTDKTAVDTKVQIANG